MSFHKISRHLLASACLALLTPLAATAGTYAVSVGYADGLRGSGFFPSPWVGDAGVTFLGTTGPGADAGAIMITNTSGAAISIESVDVVVNGSGFGGIWSASFPLSLAAGGILVLTDTVRYNFDTSDAPAIVSSGDPCDGIGTDPAVCATTFPTVTIGVDGVTTTFGDTGHVLDTEGFDFATVGNESFAWRPIGGKAGPAGIPEPASLALIGLGLVAGTLARRRKA